VLIIAAAGNDYGGPCNYPGAYSEVVCVMATDSKNMLASFSNIGGEISAPGVYNYSTYLGSTYRYLSGTSMASPHVAGAAALIFSACPTCSASEVRNLINETAIDLGDPGKDILFGYGLVDLTSAFETLAPIEEEIVSDDPALDTPTEEPTDEGDDTTETPTTNPRKDSSTVQEILIVEPLPSKGLKYIPTEVSDIKIVYKLNPLVDNSNLVEVKMYLDNEYISSNTQQQGEFVVENELLNHSQHWVKVVATFEDNTQSTDQIIIDMTYLKSVERSTRKSVLGISISIFDWLGIF
jgi:hypothetical protein